MDNFLDTQKWIPIHTLPGFECCIEYYVNRNGDIKSTKGRTDRNLKHKISTNGYPTVNLTQRLGRGKIKTVSVHTLVALAFLPPPPTPMGRNRGQSVIDHKDDNKMNCCASNLQWASRKFNNTKHDYKRRPKNTLEQVQAAKDRHRIRNREFMRRKRASEKSLKIEESDT